MAVTSQIIRIETGLANIWKSAIGSRRCAMAYRVAILLPMSRFTFARGPRQGQLRVTSRYSLAFSLRELEIALYTRTQPSDYAIRSDAQRIIGVCQREVETAVKVSPIPHESVHGFADKRAWIFINIYLISSFILTKYSHVMPDSIIQKSYFIIKFSSKIDKWILQNARCKLFGWSLSWSFVDSICFVARSIYRNVAISFYAYTLSQLNELLASRPRFSSEVEAMPEN